MFITERRGLIFWWGNKTNLGGNILGSLFADTWNPVIILISTPSTSFIWFRTWVGKRNVINRSSKFPHHSLEKSLNCSCQLRINYKILNVDCKVLPNLVQSTFFKAHLLLFHSNHPKLVMSYRSNILKISFYFSCMALLLLFLCQGCPSCFLWTVLTLSSRYNIVCKTSPIVTDKIIHFLSFKPRNNVLSPLY